MNTKARRGKSSGRQLLFSQLLLQAEVLCESHDPSKQREVLSRMLHLILEVTKKERRLNAATRQILADHFVDSATADGGAHVELGGPGDRDALYLRGAFDVDELAKRLVWSSERYRETVEAKT